MATPKATQDDFNTFLKDIDALEELNHIETESNFFDILDITRTEIRHSNVLAWLLDPNKSKDVGKFFLRKLLLLIMERGKENFKALDLILDDFDEIEVARECMNTDILVIIKKKEQIDYVICIENKVDSKQSKDQLKRYREKILESPILKDAVEKGRISFLFLRAHDESPNDKNWLEFDYNDIGKILEEALNHCSLTEELALFLRQYLSNLKKYEIMDFVEKQDSAQKIYNDHKDVLDYISFLRKKKVIEGVEFQPLINELRQKKGSAATQQNCPQKDESSNLQDLAQKIYNRYQKAIDYIEITAQSEDAQRFKHYHKWLDNGNYIRRQKRAFSYLQFATDELHSKVFGELQQKSTNIDLVQYCYYEIQKRYMTKIKLVLHKDESLPISVSKRLDEVRRILNGDSNEEWEWASACTEKIDITGAFDGVKLIDENKLNDALDKAFNKCQKNALSKISE